jgi:hypothetical protein
MRQIRASTTSSTIFATGSTKEHFLQALEWIYNNALREQEELINMDRLLKDSQMIMIHKYLKKKKKPWCIRGIFRGKKSKG